jgi:hypothetical protein
VLERLSNVLVSIDGGEAITDGYRGRGIYRQVLKNLRSVRTQIGGSVTARVTWGNPATSFDELDALVADDSPFDYLYWQFVADEPVCGRLGGAPAAPCCGSWWLASLPAPTPLPADPADGHRAQQAAARPCTASCMAGARSAGCRRT